MDPTALPTDSLYKFWALGALLAMGSILYFARRRSQELHLQKDALELDIKKHNRRITHLNADADAGTASLERKREAELAAAEHAHKLECLSRVIDQAESSSNWSLFGIVLSFLLAIAGFWFWYINAQRYQDEATRYALREQKARAELAEMELMEKRKAVKP
jgi:ATP-dependent Zn protease